MDRHFIEEMDGPLKLLFQTRKCRWDRSRGAEQDNNYSNCTVDDPLNTLQLT